MPPAKKRKPRQASGEFGSATKTLAVLRAFIDLQDRWGVRELAHALDQPISSTHRLLQILRADALVEWDAEAQQYTIGREAYRWAAALGERFELLQPGRAAAEGLAAATGHGAALAVLDAPRDRVFFAAQVDGPRSLAGGGRVGRFESTRHSPAGRVLLGKEGFAFAPADAAAAHPATFAAAVPGARPETSLVLFVAGPRLPAAEIRRLGAIVREHAGRLAQRAGMRLLAGSAGGASHTGVAAIAGLARGRLPDLRLVTHAMHGRRNLSALENGEAAYCTAVLGSLEAAFLGAGPHGRPHRRLRLVAALAPLLLHVLVRADSPAKTFRDLLGTRVSAGERDYATVHAFTRLAALCGRSPRDLERALARTVYLDYVEAHREFQAGKIDALVSLDSVTNPAYLRIAREVPLRLLPLDGDLLARFTAEERFYFPAEIPAGAYPGCRATRTARTSLVMVTTADRPDAEVREFLAAIHAGRGRLAETAPGFAAGPPQECGVPLHPGARRYWANSG